MAFAQNEDMIETFAPDRADESLGEGILPRAARGRENFTDSHALHTLPEGVTVDRVAVELGMRPLVAHCHLGLGKLYRRTGQRDQAQEHLTTATTMYREMGMTYWLEHAEPEMRELA